MNIQRSSWRAGAMLLLLLKGSHRLDADVTIGGVRPTTLHVPASYDPQVSAPLLLLLHGCPSDAAGPYGENVLKLGPLCDEMGILFAAPDGSGAPGQRSWGSCSGSFEVSSAYLRSLIEETQSLFNVDRSRIFLVGYSDGGVMSYRMACDHPDLVAAIACLAGANFSGCKPSIPVPILDVHGTADGNVTYTEGLNSIRAFVSDSMWEMEQVEAGQGPEIVQGVTTTVSRWGVGCLPDGFVELWSLPGVNHFPSLLADGATTALGSHMVDWLFRHARGSTPTAAARVEPLLGVGALQLTADAAGSSAPDGAEIQSYCWSFGDGQNATGIAANHTYYDPGQRVVRLLVVSDHGAVSPSVEQVVTITCPSGDLGDWTATDIGSAPYPGGAHLEIKPETAGQLSLCAAGSGLTGAKDQFLFVHQRIDGDFRLTASVFKWHANFDQIDGFAGVMCRENLGETSRFAATILRFTTTTPLAQSATFMFRTRQAEATAIRGSNGDRFPLPATWSPLGWVRLERRGDTFAANTSPDGVIWTTIGTQVLDRAPTSMHVGIAAARSTTRTTEFDALRARVGVLLEHLSGVAFHRADPNSSGTADLSDAITIFAFLFLGADAATCRESADVNNDGAIDISDGIYLLSWLFTGGPSPAAPGPTGSPCGLDPDPPASNGDLGCEVYAACN